jgi:hypothetical protein
MVDKRRFRAARCGSLFHAIDCWLNDVSALCGRQLRCVRNALTHGDSTDLRGAQCYGMMLQGKHGAPLAFYLTRNILLTWLPPFATSAGYVLGFIGYWEAAVMKSKGCDLKHNFLTRETKQDIIIACNSVVLSLLSMRSHCEEHQVRACNTLAADRLACFFMLHCSHIFERQHTGCQRGDRRCTRNHVMTHMLYAVCTWRVQCFMVCCGIHIHIPHAEQASSLLGQQSGPCIHLHLDRAPESQIRRMVPWLAGLRSWSEGVL